MNWNAVITSLLMEANECNKRIEINVRAGSNKEQTKIDSANNQIYISLAKALAAGKIASIFPYRVV